MATKTPRLKRMHSFVATEHIRVLRSIADEQLSGQETVKGERGRIIYNPFGLKNVSADPTGERRRKMLEMWPLQSDIVKVELEGNALLVYTAIV